MSTTGQYSSREVSATLEIGKTTIPISRISLRHTIDELPYAEIAVQLDNQATTDTLQGSVGIDVEKFRRLAQLLQEKILNEFRIKPDVRLTVKDSNTTLTFNGFLGKPGVVVQAGKVQITVSLVHAKAALQAWNGQIYNYIEPYVLPTLVDAFGESASVEAQSATTDTSIALRILAMVEYAMRAVTAVPDLSSPTEFDMLPIHLMNQKSVEIVREVLLASKETTRIDGLADDEFDASNLHQVLFETLRNSPNFMTVLKTMGQMFMFQINADWKGNLWLEPIRSIEDPGEREIAVPLAAIAFNCAHLYELPISQVIVVGAGIDLYVSSGVIGVDMGGRPPEPIPMPGGEFFSGRVASEGEVWTKMQCYSKYPAQVERGAVGNFYILQAPSWINSSAIMDAQLSQMMAGVSPDYSRFDQIVAVQKSIQDAFLAAEKPRKKILSYLAKQLFQSLYLGATHASITVPFDLRPCVGRTYTVKDMSGKGIFIGFLRDVAHDVALSDEGGGGATTTLIFTHIKMVGARLNQLLPRPTNPAPTGIGSDAVDESFRSPQSVPPTTLAETFSPTALV